MMKTWIATAAVLAALAGPAAAQMFGGGQWYVKGFAGATWPMDDDFRLDLRGTGLSRSADLSYGTGYTLGASVGLIVDPSLAVELEYAYRNADADSSVSGFGSGSGKTEVNAFMANALYRFNGVGAGGAWTPYLGGGIGTAALNIEDFGNTGGDLDSDYNFAYQLIGGVEYAVSPALSLLGEARYFGINDQEIKNDDLSLKTTYSTFDLLVGVRYGF